MTEECVQNTKEDDFQNEFNRSLSFLQELSTRKKRKNKRKANKQNTLRRAEVSAEVSVDAPRDMFEITTPPLEQQKQWIRLSLQ